MFQTGRFQPDSNKKGKQKQYYYPVTAMAENTSSRQKSSIANEIPDWINGNSEDNLSWDRVVPMLLLNDVI